MEEREEGQNAMAEGQSLGSMMRAGAHANRGKWDAGGEGHGGPAAPRGKSTFGAAFASGRGTVGKLVVCPTPIGNLGDMPPRAINALKSANVVYAEDTRVTGKLLSSFGISARLERLDENTLGQRASSVVERVAAGETIAYCTDAGMPGVSDPGQRLVAAAREAGVRVDVLPGPTAVSTAYVASGFTCPRFYFGGFFPRKDGERASTLAGLRALDAVLLFYESPHRLVPALRAVAEALPHRRVCVCRELTKLHEEVVLGSAAELAERFAQREAEGGVKGEIVIVVDAPGDAERAADAEGAAAAAQERAAQLAREGMRGKQIAKQLAADYGISRNDAYEMALAATKQAKGE